jgi:hypothetical protein
MGVAVGSTVGSGAGVAVSAAVRATGAGTTHPPSSPARNRLVRIKIPHPRVKKLLPNQSGERWVVFMMVILSGL